MRQLLKSAATAIMASAATAGAVGSLLPNGESARTNPLPPSASDSGQEPLVPCNTPRDMRPIAGVWADGEASLRREGYIATAFDPEAYRIISPFDTTLTFRAQLPLETHEVTLICQAPKPCDIETIKVVGRKDARPLAAMKAETEKKLEDKGYISVRFRGATQLDDGSRLNYSARQRGSARRYTVQSTCKTERECVPGSPVRAR